MMFHCNFKITDKIFLCIVYFLLLQFFSDLPIYAQTLKIGTIKDKDKKNEVTVTYNNENLPAKEEKNNTKNAQDESERVIIIKNSDLISPFNRSEYNREIVIRTVTPPPYNRYYNAGRYPYYGYGVNRFYPAGFYYDNNGKKYFRTLMTPVHKKIESTSTETKQ